jgi:transcriptional regulator with XRE-family HTH domain
MDHTGAMGRQAFGAALRQLRERTEPAAVGVPAGGRRRARGLRREELADLAGVSADYVRRLEQGVRHPSAGVVTALARALRLGRAEYERLCALAGHAAADGRVPREAGAGAVRLLERLDGAPVCLFDAAWNVVAWNGAWAALQCGEPTTHPWGGNLAWRVFGGAPGRVSRTVERAAGFETMLAARLRSTSLRYPADTSLAALVDELRSTSGPFDRLWRTGRTAVAQEDRAVLSHPDVGEVTLDCDLFAVPDGDTLAMIFTTRPGSVDAARLGEIVGGRPATVSLGRIGPG